MVRSVDELLDESLRLFYVCQIKFFFYCLLGGHEEEEGEKEEGEEEEGEEEEGIGESNTWQN